MSQTDSPRGILNSPRNGPEHEKALSRDISLAVAAIIEESKTYKDLDYLDSNRKHADSPRVLNELLLQKESLESAASSSKGSSSSSQRFKKFKKKIIKKVKSSVPKIASITSAASTESANKKITGRPPPGPVKPALAPLLATTKSPKKLTTAAAPQKSTSKSELKGKASNPKIKRAKTSLNDTREKNTKNAENPTTTESTSTLLSSKQSNSELGATLPKGSQEGADGKSKEAESQPNQKQDEKRHVPSPPSFKDYGVMEIVQFISSVQKYMDQLGYERNGEPKIRVNTKLSMKHLMGTAKQLIKAGEQIKCLHALVMGVHFTNNCNIVERFPIHFRSLVNGKTYKHVTLGIYLLGNYGALGISRDTGLQDKPPIYPRLSDMINDYFRHYTDAGHELKEVQIGNIISHNPHSLEPITWKLAKIDMQTLKLAYETEIEKCSRKLRSQMGAACLKCSHMDPYEYIEHTASSKVLSSQKSKSLSMAAMRSRSNATSKAISLTRAKPSTSTAQKPRKPPAKPNK